LRRRKEWDRLKREWETPEEKDTQFINGCAATTCLSNSVLEGAQQKEDRLRRRKRHRFRREWA